MKIGVVGAGTMGNGIAQVAAFHGHRVTLCDTSASALEKAIQAIERSLERITRKMGEEEAGGRLLKTLQRIETGTDEEALAESDFVIEAVFEDFAIKREVLQKLDAICRHEAVLASNTSSISITRLAACTRRPRSVVGMHFMNPVPVMRLVEIVRGLESSDDTVEKTRRLAVAWDKVPVEVRDFPGFVSNRVLLPMLNEAMFAVMEGVADAESVDAVMKLGMNHPMGPLQLADLIGLDVCLDILNVLFDGYRDPKYRPCPLLQQMVAGGRLGRKSGRGFYAYE